MVNRTCQYAVDSKLRWHRSSRGNFSPEADASSYTTRDPMFWALVVPRRCVVCPAAVAGPAAARVVGVFAAQERSGG